MTAAGDLHVFEGYSFRETASGPVIEGECVDCGARVYVVQPTGRLNQWGLEEDAGSTAEARCSTCGRKHYRLPAF